MQRLLICLVLSTCLCVSAWSTDGVKGRRRLRYPSNGNYHGSNFLQNGLCYKTVPYSRVLAWNSSVPPYNTIPQPPKGQFTNNSGWITILDCCNGYERNVTSGLCEPHICQCKPGYVWNELKGCVAVCNGHCPHGKCTAPGVCTCDKGYVNPDGDRESCIPYCLYNCFGGKCVASHNCIFLRFR